MTTDFDCEASVAQTAGIAQDPWVEEFKAQSAKSAQMIEVQSAHPHGLDANPLFLALCASQLRT
jgi:hypothetical protein